MVPNETKEKFIEELYELPIVSVVCKRVGISKATVYRWREEDSQFRDRIASALKHGRETVNDLAESRLVNLIKKEHMPAIRMWLEAHDERFYKPRSPMSAPIGGRHISTVKIQIVTPEGRFTDENGVYHPPTRPRLYSLKRPKDPKDPNVPGTAP